jgi:hypothetical protein
MAKWISFQPEFVADRPATEGSAPASENEADHAPPLARGVDADD